ncbi:choice-of-anchor I family protein [Oceaniserpentilla sp. 4NH20-0058]|uniref:choice-of-anchor I family protein n=1 Tax=Oceaniserpentilla sp. 4NH20-0058 TaxID=3127660 RepID=UPI003105E5D4
MKPAVLPIMLASTLTVLTGCGSDSDDNKQTKTFSALNLEVVGTYVSGNEFDTSSAEIVSYDQTTDRLYVVNAEDKTIDILRFDNSGIPLKDGTINLQAAATHAGISIGAANSVVAKDALVAVAIENDNKQGNGIIALYDSNDLSLINTFTAGALPDMVTMTDDANFIVVANEGEPSGDYTVDPEGSVTLVNISSGTSNSNAVVTQIDFKAFNQGQSRHSELNNVRLPSPFGASVAQDLEPEYITITTENKAVVALQENNAFAIIDIATASVESIKGLGEKSWAPVADGGQGYELDLTNKDETLTYASYPQLAGYYMPDSLASFEVDGATYIISANEGDGREYVYETTQSVCESANHTWDGDDFASTDPEYTTEEDDCISYTDEARGKNLNVDPAHPLMNESVYGEDGTIANKNAIGRVKVIADDMDIAANETVHIFGARSFSIWNMNAEQVFDSGDELSKIANTTSHFNVSNDNQDNDDRSDDKGVEPEAIEVASILDKKVAFIGLERQGGIAAYDVTNPAESKLLTYINNRDFTADICTAVDGTDCDNDEYNPAAGDLGPESIEYYTRNEKHYIAVGNEVSGTTTVYEIQFEEETANNK